MDKKELLGMILEYAMYRQNVTKAMMEFKIMPTPQNEDIWLNLIVEDDDKWQKLVNYVYQDDESIDF